MAIRMLMMLPGVDYLGFLDRCRGYPEALIERVGRER